MFAITGAGAIGRLWAYRFGANHCHFLTTKRTPHTPKAVTFDVETTATAHTTSVTIAQQHINSYSCISTENTYNPKIASSQLTNSKAASSKLDAVIICTKSLQAVSAANALDAALPKTIPFVLFQNGMGSQKNICHTTMDRAVYAAITTSGANISNSGKLKIAGEGITTFGPLNTLAEDAGDKLVTAFQHSCSHPIEFVQDIKPQMWRKLIINCGINAITAIENCANGKITTTPTFITLWPQLLIELTALSNLAALNMNSEEIESLVLGVVNDTSGNISSMLQDVRSGKPTEINDINGFALKTLKHHGVSALANQTLIEKVHALRD